MLQLSWSNQLWMPSSSCLGNSGCFGLSGLNLTDCEGGGGGGLVGCGGLVH